MWYDDDDDSVENDTYLGINPYIRSMRENCFRLYIFQPAYSLQCWTYSLFIHKLCHVNTWTKAVELRILFREILIKKNYANDFKLYNIIKVVEKFPLWINVFVWINCQPTHSTSSAKCNSFVIDLEQNIWVSMHDCWFRKIKTGRNILQ